MALIVCQDCGASVSDRAAACPKCGGPMGDGSRVTTQQTGKGIKLVEALAVLGIFVLVPWSCMEMSADDGSGMPALALGVCFIVFLFARLARWWEHG